jgi:hypothetical protein
MCCAGRRISTLISLGDNNKDLRFLDYSSKLFVLEISVVLSCHPMEQATIFQPQFEA